MTSLLFLVVLPSLGGMLNIQSVVGFRITDHSQAVVAATTGMEIPDPTYHNLTHPPMTVSELH